MGDIKCLSCPQEFGSYQELALHISSSKTGHRRGKRWAAKYISRHVINKRRRDISGRSPATVKDIKNKEDTRRELSGKQMVADTICPKCHKSSRVMLEAEYITSPQAWRLQWRLVKICVICGVKILSV